MPDNEVVVDEVKEFENVTYLLSYLQKELDAPKSQFSQFGNYYYRKTEDILEALKPLLPVGAVVNITDEVVYIGNADIGAMYVKATASIEYKDKTRYATSFAREQKEKKGFDSSQLTGSASSYARKYALNGLFMIDDSKDADDDSEKEQTKPVVKTEIKNEKSVDPDLKKRANEINEALKGADSVFKIDNIWNLQEKDLQRIKAASMKAYQSLDKAYLTCRAALEEKDKAQEDEIPFG